MGFHWDIWSDTLSISQPSQSQSVRLVNVWNWNNLDCLLCILRRKHFTLYYYNYNISSYLWWWTLQFRCLFEGFFLQAKLKSPIFTIVWMLTFIFYCHILNNLFWNNFWQWSEYFVKLKFRFHQALFTNVEIIS